MARWRFGEVLCSAIRDGRKSQSLARRWWSQSKARNQARNASITSKEEGEKDTNPAGSDRLHFIACTMRGTATQPRDAKTNGSQLPVSLDACAGSGTLIRDKVQLCLFARFLFLHPGKDGSVLNQWQFEKPAKAGPEPVLTDAYRPRARPIWPNLRLLDGPFANAYLKRMRFRPRPRLGQQIRSNT